ncbi:PP2C family protein-serine/threonine phosphatase [Actinomycetospora lemnae]|uniref:PP2C family protein-serine/threonine phosphatase n=1 Tax=Actinomycetospora lemnae TaxID=3019891 RepID=A0ABT5SZH9_9PSEU|nr:PP2C family protein-serine/threonine phosphatase [Actinomycetospora sp. DW7H6]MDD7967835.1 PP2C family protein-serine/threonine phosphatase [Actinomycetospora sp. DW7H6]
MRTDRQDWGDVLTALTDRSHLVVGEDLSTMVDEIVAPRGLRAEVLLVDLGQEVLTSVRADPPPPVPVEGTLAGRAFQHGEFVAGFSDEGRRVLWVPMLDGTERAGVVRLDLDPDVVDDLELRRRCWTLSGVMGHIAIGKLPYSDRIRRIRAPRPLSVAAELLWQLVPPRTFATGNVVVTALLEPYDQVAGDAYDYVVDAQTAYVAVFDGVGHDLAAGSATALAVSAIRNARRRGVADLAALAAEADVQMQAAGTPPRFVTAVLARLDLGTGELRYLVAGHPPPLLLRQGHLVEAFGASPRFPLGVVPGGRPASAEVAVEWLEPDDRVVFYSDGITEARDTAGRFFGDRRLADLSERAELDEVSAPETLRRLAAAVLEHQGGVLQDDATLLMLDWSSTGHERLLPSVARHRDARPPTRLPEQVRGAAAEGFRSPSPPGARARRRDVDPG